jgi:hypothetical protein
MEDYILQSLCADPTSYCAFQAQREASEQSKAPRRQISHDRKTYVHMVIPIQGHWVSVQVTISPFVLEKYPGQTFFSSQLRCGPCCRRIGHTDTLWTATSTVQQVIDSSYRSVCWNYSLGQCAVDEPTNSGTEQCEEVAKRIFQAYATTSNTAPSCSPVVAHGYSQSGPAVVSMPLACRSVTDKARSAQHLDIASLLAPADAAPGHSTNETLNGANGSTSCTECSSGKRKRKRGSTGWSGVLSTTSVRSRVSKDKTIAVKMATMLTKGITEQITENGKSLTPLAQFLSTRTEDDAKSYADCLWEFAEQVDKMSNILSWSVHYLACCCSLVAVKYATPAELVLESNVSRKNLHNWRGGAEVMNKIVNAMLPSWKSSAYRLFHIFVSMLP